LKRKGAKLRKDRKEEAEDELVSLRPLLIFAVLALKV
jgi:hypothetical protein